MNLKSKVFRKRACLKKKRLKKRTFSLFLWFFGRSSCIDSVTYEDFMEIHPKCKNVLKSSNLKNSNHKTFQKFRKKQQYLL